MGQGYLLDTNVISDEGKLLRNPKVVKWLNEIDLRLVWMSVVVLGEARRWVALQPEGRKKRELRARMAKWENWPSDRVLPVTLEIALCWGMMSVRRQPLRGVDGLIAATAVTHGMILATGNVKHFRDIPGLTVFNPWEE